MLTTKPQWFFKPDPNQVRKHFTETEFLSLVASMEASRRGEAELTEAGSGGQELVPEAPEKKVRSS